MDLLTSTVLIFMLIFISAFFSSAEISLAASRKIRLVQLRDEGDPRAGMVLELLAQPGHFFTTVQIALNVVAIFAGVIGESVYTPSLTLFYGQWLDDERAASLASLSSFAGVTVAFILLADLIPKRIAMVISERLALRVIRPIRWTILIFRPLIFLLNGIANQVIRLLGFPQTQINDITAADIIAMTNAGALTGEVAAHERRLIENIFELEERNAPSSMTTRESIVWIERGESEESIRTKIIGNPHAKYPVCMGAIDQVIGYVDAQDILCHLLQGKAIVLREDGDGLLRNALILPESLSLAEIMAQFKAARESFALIINEYALVVGLITLNDITLALLGDDHVAIDEEQIIQRDENSWLVEGLTVIGDLQRILEIERFPDDDQYETIAGFMMYMLRKVPKRTDSVTHAGYKFEVVDIDHYKIDQLLVTRLASKPDESFVSRAISEL
ncbi:MAG: HlyC/CorC family transporter [Gammaproteobacteria bacterium]|nr:HlyC/CorC family transporter [Gammaproteobacteria bacterium]